MAHDGAGIPVEHDLGAVMEKVMIMGDLSPLTPAQRSEYYMRVCQSLGLNHLTKPFAYIKLNGKLVLYALRDCADQLRSKRGISIEVIDRKILNGLLSVHVRAKDKDGRQDEDIGVVPIPQNGLQGDAGANLIMKCVTKAKRRVTLSICGLGMLDETEVVTVPGAELVSADGEVIEAGPQPQQNKSAAEGKRDGSAKFFDELRHKIHKAQGPVECAAAWKDASKRLPTLSRAWFDNIAEEFVAKMDTWEVNIELDNNGWPILESKEAAR